MVNRLVLIILFFIPQWVYAATYNICSSGGDYTTFAAFKAAVPSPAAGSDVQFCKGETFQPTASMIINWSGSAGDKVEITSYGSGARPIIDGQDQYPGPLPCLSSGCWENMIDVRGNYIEVHGLEIENIEGRGIGYTGSNNKGYDLVVHNVYRQPVVASNASNIDVTDSIMYEYGRRNFEDSSSGIQSGVTLAGVTGGNILRNTLYRSYGEAVDVITDSTGVLVSQNHIWAARVGIYFDAAQNSIATFNVINGTTDTNVIKVDGLAMNIESWQSAVNMDSLTFFGNIVTGYPNGIRMTIAKSGATATNIVIANNSLIGNDYSFASPHTPFTSTIVRSNISWPWVAHYTGSSSVSGITFDYNQWSSEPPSYLRNANDVIGAPDYYTPGQFRTLADGTAFHIYDVSMKNGSIGIGSAYQWGAFQYTQLFLESDDQPESATLSTVSTWDMGAVDYAGSPVSVEYTCNDRIDNDGDGLTDCADSDCSGKSYCESPETTCNDGFDNDGDGLIDCLSGIPDPDCSCAPPSPSGQPLMYGGQSQ